MNAGKKLFKGLVAALFVASMCFVGCASSQVSTATESQQANRAYMSQVNEAMADLDGKLDAFIDAVSRGDVVNMRTQADDAYVSLDKLTALDAPEDLADIKASYIEGVGKLREALDSYIALYSKASNAGTDFDWSAYDEDIAKIQKLYDEGVAALEQGDKAAAEAK